MTRQDATRQAIRNAAIDLKMASNAIRNNVGEGLSDYQHGLVYDALKAIDLAVARLYDADGDIEDHGIAEKGA